MTAMIAEMNDPVALPLWFFLILAGLAGWAVLVLLLAPGMRWYFRRRIMDYVLVAFLAAERATLSFAVGEWARIFIFLDRIRITPSASACAC